MMPCGCFALPVDLLRVFGSDISSFICDEHGEVKVSKKWLKDVVTGVGILKKIPSEFGYQVEISDLP
jgi:hypothetical protein